MTELVIDNLTAGYRGEPAVRGVSLRACGGEVLALIGPNGAGKTTLLRAIDATLRPISGTVRLDGTDVTALGPTERARRIALVPQGLRLPEGFTVAEVVLMGRNPHLPPLGGERPQDYELARQAMRRAGVLALAGRRVHEISGGEQQRVLIARALAQTPRVLLLDEATAHLDLRHQGAIMRLVRRLARGGLAVIAAMHDLNLAAFYADRLALLRAGELLACGRPAAVLTPELLRRAYDTPVALGAHPRYGTPTVHLLDEEGPDE
ncbi:MAG TPA: ABC transporter ATP-binding protein [Roseiflexaceae bacterium]|nr:ABC transporter ATP-binding protein [Roseiflexaceae bacterium]